MSDEWVMDGWWMGEGGPSKVDGSVHYIRQGYPRNKITE